MSTKDTIVYDLMSGKYILPICIGDVSEEYRLNSLTEIQQEIISRYYPHANYTVDADTSAITYTINGNKYEINRHESEGYKFIKNGKKLDISIIKNSYWLKTKDRGCSSYSIHLKDFAQIMEMDFEDIQGNALYFTTKDTP